MTVAELVKHLMAMPPQSKVEVYGDFGSRKIKEVIANGKLTLIVTEAE